MNNGHTHHIHHVAASANEIRSFGDALLVFDEQGERLLAHLVEPGAHIVGSTVGREDSHALQSGLSVQAVDVLQADVVVQLTLLCLDVEILVYHASLPQIAYPVLIEAIGQDAVFVHQIGHEDQASGLSYTSGLVQRTELLFVAKQVIEGAEQQRDVGGTSG